MPTVIDLLSLQDQYDRHRERVHHTFENLPDAAEKIEGPALVFAHILSPHPPFVFDENGEAIKPDYPFSWVDGTNYLAVANRESYIEGYRQQAVFINKQLVETVERIQVRSSRPAIIILQGDRGPGAWFELASVKNTNLSDGLEAGKSIGAQRRQLKPSTRWKCWRHRIRNRNIDGGPNFCSLSP